MSSLFYTAEIREKIINYALTKAGTQEYISLGYLLDFAHRIFDVRLTSKKARNIKRWIDRILLNTPYFYKVKMDGILWYQMTPAGRSAYIDLMRGRLAPKQNSNHEENSGFLSYRNKAEKIIMDRKFLDDDHYADLSFYFENYLSIVENKVILLRHKTEREKFALVSYSTRFTDETRRRKLLARYDHAWSYATHHYKDGVFLTLTTDPSQFSSIYEATMAISWAWNSFMSWVQKKLKRRPPYIKVLEFTQKGMPHLHIVFFDVGYIAEHEEITEEWNRLGQGIINYEYSIVNKGGQWRWKKRKPQGGGRSVKRYLKKYLLKTMSMKNTALGTLSLYWVTNKRFYTTARILQKKLKYFLRTGEWEFFGSYYYNELNDYLPYWAHVEFSEFAWGDG